jgi:hypothetical protein
MLKKKAHSLLLGTLLTAGVLVATPASAYVDLVQNGDFSSFTSTNAGGGQIDYNTTVANWSTTGYNFLFQPTYADTTTGVTSQFSTLSLWGPDNGSNNGFNPDASPTGGNYVGADGAFNVGAITQTITGLTAGDSYNLTFWWAAAQQYTYTGANTEQWDVSLGSQTIDTAVYHNSSEGFSGWMQETFTYTATASTEVLSFLAVGTPTGQPPFSLLSNVSMEAAVPEPEILGLMGMGLLGILASRRNQRKA